MCDVWNKGRRAHTGNRCSVMSVCRLKGTMSNTKSDIHGSNSQSFNSQTWTNITDTIKSHLAKDKRLINTVADDRFIICAVLLLDHSSGVTPVMYVKCGGGTEMVVTAVEFFITVTEPWSNRRVELCLLKMY